MSYEFEGFALQGWQCPICKRVYSPTTVMCFYCGNNEIKTSNVSTAGDTPDWVHHDSITKAEER